MVRSPGTATSPASDSRSASGRRLADQHERPAAAAERAAARQQLVLVQQPRQRRVAHLHQVEPAVERRGVGHVDVGVGHVDSAARRRPGRARARGRRRCRSGTGRRRGRDSPVQRTDQRSDGRSERRQGVGDPPGRPVARARPGWRSCAARRTARGLRGGGRDAVALHRFGHRVGMRGERALRRAAVVPVTVDTVSTRRPPAAGRPAAARSSRSASVVDRGRPKPRSSTAGTRRAIRRPGRPRCSGCPDDVADAARSAKPPAMPAQITALERLARQLGGRQAAARSLRRPRPPRPRRDDHDPVAGRQRPRSRAALRAEAEAAHDRPCALDLDRA